MNIDITVQAAVADRIKAQANAEGKSHQYIIRNILKEHYKVTEEEIKKVGRKKVEEEARRQQKERKEGRRRIQGVYNGSK